MKTQKETQRKRIDACAHAKRKEKDKRKEGRKKGGLNDTETPGVPKDKKSTQDRDMRRRRNKDTKKEIRINSPGFREMTSLSSFFQKTGSMATSEESLSDRSRVFSRKNFLSVFVFFHRQD